MGEMFIHCPDQVGDLPSAGPENDRFRLVFDAVRDGIFIAEAATGQIVDVNASGYRMFGYDKDELLGRSVGPLSSNVHPYSQDQVIARFGTPFPPTEKAFEWQCRTKQGALFWSEISMRHAEFDDVPVVVAIVRDISARKRQDAEIAHMAHHDALTGLANRSVFTSTLKRAIPHCLRDARTLAILFLDLDHFKEVNDMHGHLVGDHAVRRIAERLQGDIRSNETVYSFCGDEFAILLGDAGNAASIAAVADRLLATIAEPFLVDGVEIHLGASIGVAMGADASDADTLMSHADTALFRAKAEGRNTWRFYSEAMDEERRARIILSGELRIAIPAGQLFVAYQPQVSSHDGRITGVEALVRWRHPDRGTLSPESFLPAAESSGLIVALDRWVMQEACRQARRWLDAGHAPVIICVNLSSAQFKRPLELETFVLAVLEETKMPGNSLELEITEGLFIGFSNEHRKIMQRLRGAGVRFALDDFGMGHSSLDYLRRIAVDRLKIPREFITDLSTSADAAAIVECIINLARGLGSEVIAEGVETAEQLGLLQDMGCPHIQGFHFAAPMTAEAILPHINRGTMEPAKLH